MIKALILLVLVSIATSQTINCSAIGDTVSITQFTSSNSQNVSTSIVSAAGTGTWTGPQVNDTVVLTVG